MSVGGNIFTRHMYMIYSDIWTNRGKTVLDCLNVNGHKKYRQN